MHQIATARPARVPSSLLLVAALSLGPALVHLQVTPVHWQHWWAYGVFFVVTGVAQVLYAVAIVRWPTPPVVAVGIAGNLLIVLTYVVSRTEGVPWGPHAGQAEDVGIADFTTTAGEMVLVALLVGMLSPAAARRTMTGLLLAGAGLWAARLTGTLV